MNARRGNGTEGDGPTPLVRPAARNKAIGRASVLTLLLVLALPVRAVRVRFHEGRALADDSDDRRDAIGTYAEPLGDIVVAGGTITGSARAEGGGPAYKRTYEDGPLYAAVTGHASQACAPTQPKSVHQDLLNGTAPGRGR